MSRINIYLVCGVLAVFLASCQFQFGTQNVRSPYSSDNQEYDVPANQTMMPGDFNLVAKVGVDERVDDRSLQDWKDPFGFGQNVSDPGESRPSQTLAMISMEFQPLAMSSMELKSADRFMRAVAEEKSFSEIKALARSVPLEKNFVLAFVGPERLRMPLNMANQMLLHGEYEKALEYLPENTELSMNEWGALLKGSAFLGKGDYSKAHDQFMYAINKAKASNHNSVYIENSVLLAMASNLGNVVLRDSSYALTKNEINLANQYLDIRSFLK